MKLGNKIQLILILILCVTNYSIAEEKISSTPLINIQEIKPSFEEQDEENDKIYSNRDLKKKKLKRF